MCRCSVASHQSVPVTAGLPLQPATGRMPPPSSTAQLPPPPAGFPPGVSAGLPRAAPPPSHSQLHPMLPGGPSQRPPGAVPPRPPGGQQPPTAGPSVSIYCLLALLYPLYGCEVLRLACEYVCPPVFVCLSAHISQKRQSKFHQIVCTCCPMCRVGPVTVSKWVSVFVSK